MCPNIFVVPDPLVSVSEPSTTLMVGESLTLQCNVTTVSSITMGNSLVYTDSYTISQLSTTDDGRVIQCEVLINAVPSVTASESVTLDVTCK